MSVQSHQLVESFLRSWVCNNTVATMWPHFHGKKCCILYYGYIHGGYSNFCLSRCYCRIVVVAKQKNCCVPSSANLRCLLIQFYFNFSSPSPTVWNNLPEIYSTTFNFSSPSPNVWPYLPEIYSTIFNSSSPSPNVWNYLTEIYSTIFNFSCPSPNVWNYQPEILVYSTICIYLTSAAPVPMRGTTGPEIYSRPTVSRPIPALLTK